MHRGRGLLGERHHRELGAVAAMIRQLARLARRVPAAGPHAVALGGYANDEDAGLAARDQGFEGVAGLDDAARAVGLLLDLYRATADRRLGGCPPGLDGSALYIQ